MARKESITVNQILDTAFAMTREEGFENVTARKVAAKAGCSTQPIFRVYKNMEELWNAVYDKAADFFLDFYEIYPRSDKTPFINLGMAYIAFAREEKYLFELLFLSETKADMNKKSMYELLNGKRGNVVYEINLARVQGCKDPGDLFMKMWIFIHGAACMTLTGDYDLSQQETIELLERTYRAFSAE
jgi:AcrR family transcriptional regulator